MIRFRTILTWQFIALLIFPIGHAIAQIDHRVDHRIDRGDGHLLDSNPQVGSAGRNQNRSSFDFGRRANAIATGNVTGLGRLHTTSPVFQTNQFRGTLPSSSLTGFLSESVGLSQIRSNQAVQSTFFLGRQETVPDLRFIRNRLTRPGSSVLKSPTIRPPSLQDLAPRPQRLNIPDPADLRLNLTPNVTPDVANIGVTQQSLDTNQGTIGTQSLFTSPFSSASGSSIFGMPKPANIPSKSAVRGPQSEFIRPILRPSETAPRNTNTIESARPPYAQPQQPNVRFSPPTGLHPGRDSQFAPQRTLQTTGVGTTPMESERQNGSDRAGLSGLNLARDVAMPPADFGGDRFADFSRVAAIAQQLRERRLGIGLRKAPGQALQSKNEPVVSTDAGIADLALGAKWANKLLADPVQSFVGKYQNRLNQYLAAGEDEMHQGQYYKAARQFDMAHLVDPSNPLPLLGKGHALLAAGDYLSAFISLTRGIKQFPQIAAFRLDLPAMVDQHDIFDVRRADLEKRLAVQEHYDLRFLLGYLELYSGLVQEGLRDLELAANQAPRDSVVVIFPDLIMGQRQIPEPGKTSH